MSPDGCSRTRHQAPLGRALSLEFGLGRGDRFGAMCAGRSLFQRRRAGLIPVGSFLRMRTYDFADHQPADLTPSYGTVPSLDRP